MDLLRCLVKPGLRAPLLGRAGKPISNAKLANDGERPNAHENFFKDLDHLSLTKLSLKPFRRANVIMATMKGLSMKTKDSMYAWGFSLNRSSKGITEPS